MDLVDTSEGIELDADGNQVKEEVVDTSEGIELDSSGNELTPPNKQQMDKMLNTSGYPAEGVRILSSEESQQMVDRGAANVKEKAWKAAASTFADNPLTPIMAGAGRSLKNANLVSKLKAAYNDEPIPSVVDEYRKGRDDYKSEARQATRDVSPTVAGVPVLPVIGQSIPMLGAGAPATIAGRIGLSTGVTAVNSALGSEGDLTRGEIGPVIKDGLIGGAIGAAGGLLAEGIGYGAKKLFSSPSTPELVDKTISQSDDTVNSILDFLGVKPEAKPAIMANPAAKKELLESFKAASANGNLIGPTRPELAQNARQMASQAARSGNTSELAGIGPMSKMANQAGQIPPKALDLSKPVSSGLNAAGGGAVERVRSTLIRRGANNIEKAMERLSTEGFGNLSPFELDGLKRQLATLAGMSPGDQAAYTYALSLTNPVFNVMMQDADKEQ